MRCTKLPPRRRRRTRARPCVYTANCPSAPGLLAISFLPYANNGSPGNGLIRAPPPSLHSRDLLLSRVSSSPVVVVTRGVGLRKHTTHTYIHVWCRSKVLLVVRQTHLLESRKSEDENAVLFATHRAPWTLVHHRPLPWAGLSSLLITFRFKRTPTAFPSVFTSLTTGLSSTRTVTCAAKHSLTEKLLKRCPYRVQTWWHDENVLCRTRFFVILLLIFFFFMSPHPIRIGFSNEEKIIISPTLRAISHARVLKTSRRYCHLFFDFLSPLKPVPRTHCKADSTPSTRVSGTRMVFFISNSRKKCRSATADTNNVCVMCVTLHSRFY